MICNNCKNNLNPHDKFCTNCGANVEQVIVQNQQLNNKSGLGTASLIIGIISLIFSLMLSIYPLAIVGLVLGIIDYKKSKKFVGITLNLIAMIIHTIFFIFLFLLALIFPLLSETPEWKNFFSKFYEDKDYNQKDNYVAGKYDCTNNVSFDDYIITLYLNEDNTFEYGKYGDLENNHVTGTYTFIDEHKITNNRKYKYFMINLTGNRNDFIVDGEKSDKNFDSKMEFGIKLNDGKKEGVIIFTSTNNMYYCYEQ